MLVFCPVAVSSLWLCSRTEVRFNSAFIHMWDSLLKGCLLGASLGQNHLSSEVLPHPEELQEGSRNATSSTSGGVWALTCSLGRPNQRGAEEAEGGSSGQQE